MTAAALTTTRAAVAERLATTAQPIANSHRTHRDCNSFPCRAYRVALVALLLIKDSDATVEQLRDIRRELDEAVKS